MTVHALYDTVKELRDAVGYHLKMYDTAKSHTGYKANGRLRVQLNKGQACWIIMRGGRLHEVM